jgi:hypothetical protein
MAYVYYVSEPGAAVGGEITNAGRGETDRSEYREAAGAIQAQE